MKYTCGRYCTILVMILTFLTVSNSALGDDLVNYTAGELTSSDRLQPSKYPLTGLRKSVSSIDWKASDATLKNFKQEIQKLCTIYKDDPLAVMYLQILDSFGEYIGTNQDKTNPKTPRIMKRVFLSLDEIVSVNQMPGTEIKRDRLYGQGNISLTQESTDSIDPLPGAVNVNRHPKLTHPLG